MSQSLRNGERVRWLHSIPFFTAHAVAVATPFLTPFTWRLGILALASYAVRMFRLTAGYHRYFSHRAYRTSRAFQLFLAVLGSAATQKGPLWWAGHHRNHHRNSDGPDDVHSPARRGFYWSHIGWILCGRYEATPLARVKDLARFPELRWLDRFYVAVPAAYGAALLALGGWPALLWGYFVSTVLLWHGTFFINSLAHVFGRQRYDTGDTSRNSFLLALITLGEGWHNNHHFYPSTANQGWHWWEVDASYYVLRLLARVGLVRELRTPPASIRDSHRVPAGAISRVPLGAAPE